jgi:hypothetical protein
LQEYAERETSLTIGLEEEKELVEKLKQVKYMIS